MAEYFDYRSDIRCPISCGPATSDELGRFDLKHYPGRLRLSARKDGVGISEPLDFATENEQEVTGVELRLDAGGGR